MITSALQHAEIISSLTLYLCYYRQYRYNAPLGVEPLRHCAAIYVIWNQLIQKIHDAVLSIKIGSVLFSHLLRDMWI